MAAIEVNASSSTCRKCGTAYGRLKGYFPVSYSYLYKGTGYLPYCKDCVDGMFAAYLQECKDSKVAVRQMCRKLDLYWSEKVYEAVEKQNSTRSMMTSYITKINAVKLASKSYDDTLREEGALWLEPKAYSNMETVITGVDISDEELNVSDDIVLFWGPGYTPSMYMELENRRKYWMSKYPQEAELDIGTEALIRQICSLEIDINKARMEGKPIDKYVNSLNTVLGSANLKPTQKKEDADAELEKMPLGVGIQKWEYSRPLPPTPKEKRDINQVIKNITTWYLGHACKMVGIRNSYCKMYEDAMAELRVENPDHAEEDDDTILNSVFGDLEEGGDTDES